ncbi:hypothetical protein [Paraburkholderia strydomiana]|uniref:hypothetical protein n=1 Tax=Paraburkholderia strydomiana TaxID=1245417 RepID=UPI0028638F48|nr:hypothetical protein [Paraburkholderia strydomiana]MDR7006224.1 hypothetical protein [Paraburkholderia strydomiana]
MKSLISAVAVAAALITLHVASFADRAARCRRFNGNRATTHLRKDHERTRRCRHSASQSGAFNNTQYDVG